MNKFTSSNGDPGVMGINDWSPSAPPGAGGNGGWFESTQGEGVRGLTKTPHHAGVVGVNTAGGGGVFGQSDGTGVWGQSTKGNGVYGETAGIENEPAGVWGEHKGAGVGVKAVSKDGTGLTAYSVTAEAIHAETQSTTTAALAAYQANASSSRPALYAKHAGNLVAAVFDGDVLVTGDITLANADCAEHFDVVNSELIDPGTVMIVGPDGALHASERSYDKRVVGVISGAGSYKPGLILDKHGSEPHRKPLALLGKVYCKVDASYGQIELGDLLTTSQTTGHAMKADDLVKALGAVLGKALGPLDKGCGLIPILIALQ